jgi:alpha-galactosidase
MIKKLLAFSLGVIILLGCNNERKENSIVEFPQRWKFKMGDNLEYASASFNDSNWDSINIYQAWEAQGYNDYDGYAWYRISFFLPSSLKDEAIIKDSIQFVLGKLDDTDQTFLNGDLMGENGKTIPFAECKQINDFRYKEFYYLSRKYKLSVNDPRLKWNQENMLAIRIHDHYLNGGMNSMTAPNRVFAGMIDLKDYLIADLIYQPYKLIKENSFSKILVFKNTYQKETKGKLLVTIKDDLSGKTVFTSEQQVAFKPGMTDSVKYEFTADQTKLHKAVYEFYPDDSKIKICYSQEVPYILTPKVSDYPKINNAKVYGERPGKPFVLSILASGTKPIIYGAENLPQGLNIDTLTGMFSGKIDKAGTFTIKLKAKNKLGRVARNLRVIIGDTIQLTPAMGWNSWNVWGNSVMGKHFNEAADLLVSTGLKDHGYVFINIDGGWQPKQRNPNGEINGNEKFGDIQKIGDYVHERGFKFGILSSPGRADCGEFLGSLGHELQDAKTWARWGVDYVKYDWCFYEEVARDHSIPELQKPYILMKKCLDQIDRDIVFGICQYGFGDSWEWAGKIGGNSWRTTGDINDNWQSMSTIGFSQHHAQYAGPGHFNDPDMMMVGWVGWGDVRPSQLTVSEQYTHFSLWCLLDAPILLGCDLSKLDDFTYNLLTNDEVIAINQDPLGKQAEMIKKDGDVQIWAKDMEDGSKAVGIFNLGNKNTTYNFDLSNLKMQDNVLIRNVWMQKNIGEFSKNFKTDIYCHGVVLIRVVNTLRYR